jgi:hypothetical protein
MKNETPKGVRETIRRLHPNQIIGEMAFEDAEMDEDEPLQDWVTRTGA